MRQAQEEFDRIFPGFRTEPLTLVIRSENGQPVTDQQIAEIRNGDGDGVRIHRAGQRSGQHVEGTPVPGRRVEGSVGPGHPERVGRPQRRRQEDRRAAGDLTATRPDVSVGGTPALEQDSIHSLFDKLPLMVVLLITTTTILMFLAFGSLVLPIKAARMSALTLGSTMGVLTWMFVDGHGSPAELHAAAADGPMIG